MREAADLLLFRYLVRKPDAELDLEQAALLIAEAEYPGLDVAGAVARLDSLAAETRAALRAERARAGEEELAAPPIALVVRFLFGEAGFRGNVEDYYDPRNSFLNDVLERRVGIPITLALVLMGVCRRLRIDAQGVCFPRHFLVSSEGWVKPPVSEALGGGGRMSVAPGALASLAGHSNDGRVGLPAQRGRVFVDPFDGRLLDGRALRALYEQATGEPGDIDPECLEPGGRRQILARMLNNLRAIYEVRGDAPRLRGVLQRLAVLNPSPEIESRLALLLDNPRLAPRLSVN